MSKCEALWPEDGGWICGSYAINPHKHGRDGTFPDLCDVCYWRARNAITSERLQDTRRELRERAEALDQLVGATENAITAEICQIGVAVTVEQLRTALRERVEAHEELMEWVQQGQSLELWLAGDYSVERTPLGGHRGWVAYQGIRSVDGWGFKDDCPTAWPTLADAIQHAREHREDGE